MNRDYDPTRPRAAQPDAGGHEAGENETHAAALRERFGHLAVQRRLKQRAERRDPDAEVQAAAARGTQGAGGALPHKEEIQRSFGHHDISHVRAHTDGAAQAGAAEMGAEAFTVGDRVAFAGAPSLHTAAHEAAHAVQQRRGVHLKGGVGAEGDAYEQHADAVADRVVKGESAQELLDQHAGGGGGGGGGAAHASEAQEAHEDEAHEGEEGAAHEGEAHEGEVHAGEAHEHEDDAHAHADSGAHAPADAHLPAEKPPAAPVQMEKKRGGTAGAGLGSRAYYATHAAAGNMRNRRLNRQERSAAFRDLRAAGGHAVGGHIVGRARARRNADAADADAADPVVAAPRRQISPAAMSAAMLDIAAKAWPTLTAAHLRSFVRGYFLSHPDTADKRWSVAVDRVRNAIEQTVHRATVSDADSQIKVKIVGGTQYIFHREGDRTIHFTEPHRAKMSAEAKADLDLYGGNLSQVNAKADLVLTAGDMKYAGVASGATRTNNRGQHYKGSNHNLGKADDYMTHGGDAYVWHHHADPDRMMLIARDVHTAFGHHGGFEAWGS